MNQEGQAKLRSCCAGMQELLKAATRPEQAAGLFPDFDWNVLQTAKSSCALQLVTMCIEEDVLMLHNNNDMMHMQECKSW